MGIATPKSTADIEREMREGMNSPDCIFKHRFSRILWEASWFAEEVTKNDTFDEEDDGVNEGTTVLRELHRASESDSSLSDNSRWDEAGYIYNDTRDGDAIGDFRRLAKAMEEAAPFTPRHEDGLLSHARLLREALAASEKAAHAAVTKDVTRRRRRALWWRIPLAGLAGAGIVVVWGRPLSWWVALVFLVCVEVLRSYKGKETRDQEVERRCREIGWPLRA